MASYAYARNTHTCEHWNKQTLHGHSKMARLSWESRLRVRGPRHSPAETNAQKAEPWAQLEIDTAERTARHLLERLARLTWLARLGRLGRLA